MEQTKPLFPVEKKEEPQTGFGSNDINAKSAAGPSISVVSSEIKVSSSGFEDEDEANGKSYLSLIVEILIFGKVPYRHAEFSVLNFGIWESQTYLSPRPR